MKKYQLPKEFAEKWVAALRSGEYKQTKNTYTKGRKCFCAMGLGHYVDGCKPYLLVPEEGDWSLDKFSDNLPTSRYSINGLLYVEITNMNDSGKSFPEIADWIESNVEFI